MRLSCLATTSTLSPAHGKRRRPKPPALARRRRLVLPGLLTTPRPASAARSALIQNVCHVKDKDIRKFLDGIYVSHKGTVITD